MASPFQQRSLQRKFIYFGLIVALFTGSLLFRKLVVNEQARELRLRQEDQGEVALTDTAMRLSLGGLRGLAVTSLWLTAIERQKRHEWSELEAAVRSLTKLQPHYVSPWLFQSWNLAFNVSVECDRPRDKYFYISRGIELLAEGERKNRGNELPDPELRSPAHPEMRYYIGFTGQLKIGTGDEKRTLRSLFDLSCIPPNSRRPEPFLELANQVRELENKLSELTRENDPRAAAVESSLKAARERLLERQRKFCDDYPRLVRRLREQLGYEKFEDVVNFLADNRDLPSRFERPDDENSPPRLRPAKDQFPVLPPRKNESWPDPEDVNFGGVETDVFVVARAWYGYAQEPLPPPSHKPGVTPEAVPGRHRMPHMSQYIFRSYPARSQGTYAEELEKEGWFEGEGWAVAGWFDELPGSEEVVAGRGRFDARAAWDRCYEQFLRFGVENGLYLRPRWDELLREARKKGPGSPEGQLVMWMGMPLNNTNYHESIENADGERRKPTVVARRKLYRAERLNQENNIRLLQAYRDAFADWEDVTLQFPGFARQATVQEDLYEAELTYVRKLQRHNKALLEPLFKGVAQAAWPPGFIESLLAYANEKRVAVRIVPTRKFYGPLDMVFVYVGTEEDPRLAEPQREGVKQFLLAAAGQSLWPPLPPAGLKRLLTDRQDRRVLRVESWRGEPHGPGWVALMDDQAIDTVRNRFGLSPMIHREIPAEVLPQRGAPPGAPPPPGPPATRGG